MKIAIPTFYWEHLIKEIQSSLLPNKMRKKLIVTVSAENILVGHVIIIINEKEHLDV